MPLKSIKTDKGGEYVSQDWMNYCGGKGIDKQTTHAYSPEQNGICERLNITLTEKMRCILIWSRLPKSYWDVALLHANWLRNITLTKSLAGKIPIEVWEGKKLKMNKSHNFRCLVQYLMVGAEKSKQGDKFAPRT